MSSLLNANQSQQPQQSTGGDPFKTDQIGSSNARLAEMQKALAGGRRKRKPTKGGAVAGTVVAQYPNASPALNQNFVKLAAVGGQAEANRTFTGGKQSGGKQSGWKQSGGRRKKGRKNHKKRRQYAKNTRRRYKH